MAARCVLEVPPNHSHFGPGPVVSLFTQLTSCSGCSYATCVQLEPGWSQQDGGSSTTMQYCANVKKNV